ncbi:MAG: hypothetical protein HC945_01210 [Nitrosarchaeum sp.]|nr:hypothetical protein [Nitrosarchaeum sp.]
MRRRVEQEVHHAPWLVGVLICAMMVMVLLLPGARVDDVAELESSSLRVAAAVRDLGPVKQGRVDMHVLEELAEEDYGNLRTRLGIEEDYCILVEDAQGRVIPINGHLGIGDGDLVIAGVPCGSKVVS